MSYGSLHKVLYLGWIVRFVNACCHLTGRAVLSQLRSDDKGAL